MLRDMLKCFAHRMYGAVMLIFMLCIAPMVAAQSGDTNCAPRTLPWHTSFEENEGGLACWTLMQASTQEPMISQYVGATTGNMALSLAARGNGESCLLATPRMAYRADSLMVGFELTLNGEAGTLQVGLVSDTTAPTTFMPLLTLDLTTATTGYYELYTTAACGTDSLWVAFRLTGGLVAIDDVSVEVAGNCRRPSLPWISDVSISSATVGWTSSGGAASAYVVRCIDTATGNTLYFNTYSTTCSLTGLAAGTTYNVAVAAICGTDTTRWLPAGWLTTDVRCRTPYTFDVASLSANTAAIAWTYDTLGVNQPTAMLVDLYDLTASGAHHGTTITSTSDFAFAEGLTTGHRYQAVLQTICTLDTANPVSLTFMPLADACTEHGGTGFSSSLPISSQMAYSYAQMLYPKDILAGTDTLFAVAVRIMGNNSFAPRRIDMYIGQTADSVLTENISTVFATKVLDNYTIGSQVTGWLTMPLMAPLHVDTGLNLVVTVVDHTQFPSGPIYFSNHVEAYGGSLYGTSATLPFDPTQFSLPLSNIASVADLQLFGNCAPSPCQPPVAIVTDITTTSLTLAWSGNGAAMVRYRVQGSLQWTTAATTASTYTITSLNAATNYELQVGLPCSGDTVWTLPMEAMTSCGTTMVPYLTDFSTGAHPCWDGQQRPQAGGVLADGIMMSPEINVALNTLQVRMMLHGNGNDEYVYVGVGNDVGSVTWVDTVPVDFDEFAERTAYLDNYSGTASRVMLAGSGGAVIQWVSIEPLDECLPPRHIAISGVNDIGATLAWRGSTGQTYTVYLREANGNLWAEWTAASTQLTISGLQPNTDYVGYAVSHCNGVAEASSPAWFRFSTACGMIRHLPFHEGFESMNNLQCWQMFYADPNCARANPMTIDNNTPHSGLYSFRFSSYNYVESEFYNQYLVSPRIAATDSFTVAFYYTKSYYANEPFMLGVSSQSSNIQDFIWYERVEPTAGTWQRYEKRLPAGVRYVAIQYAGEENYYLYIDDLTIDGAGCPPPTITSVDEQTDHVTVGWQANGENVQVAITDGLWLDNIEGTQVGGNSFTFNGLQPGHNYTIGVRSICPDGHLSDWTTRNVVTIDTSCIAPTALAVDSISYTMAIVSWIPASNDVPCQICLVADGELIWQSQPLEGSACMLDGLEPNMDYSVLVRALCSGTPGPWSDTLHMHTTECLPVGEVSYERVDFRTVIISWEEAPVSTGRCRIEYGIEGFERGTGRVVTATSNPFTIYDLEPEPNYDFYLQNYCEPNVLSDTAILLNVPTGLGIEEIGAMTPLVTLHPNPAATDITVSIDAPAMISIVDISGREILSPTTVQSSFLIPHSSLTPGTYFVRVVNSAGSTVKKLIVR